MPIQEISLTLPNRPGALAGVARVLAKERINLAAISVDSTPSRGRVRLIVSDPERTHRLLSEAEYEVELREMLVIRLEDRAGVFLKVLEILAQEKINIQNVAILLARDNGRALVALSATDLGRARKVLQQAGVISPYAEQLVSNADLVAAVPTLPTESVGFLM